MNIGEEVICFMLDYAQFENARFQEDTLNSLSPEARQYLFDAKFLVKTGELATHIYEYGMALPVQTVYGSDPPCRFVFEGDEIVKPPISRLELYAGDYGPLAGMIKRDFATKNPVQVLIPGLLWMCGNAGRQQREVFLARNAGKDANVTACLKQQPDRSVVLQIGVPDKSLSERFNEAQVCQVSDILSWENDGLVLDKSVIAARIDDMLAKKDDPLPRSGKEFQRAKKTVENILFGSFKVLLINARKAENGQGITTVPVKTIRRKGKKMQYQMFHDQASLAELAKISPKMMTQIKQEWETCTIDESHVAFLLLLDFFKKQKFDTDSVFDFYDRHRTELRQAGFDDGY